MANNTLTSKRLSRMEMLVMLDMIGITPSALDMADQHSLTTTTGAGVAKFDHFEIRRTPLEALYTITFYVREA